ncbi:hypothetical protein [Planctomicrobium sp. SH664]|uniref:hypothetical protein n=1 Tax=Planctomicrobium sp. SH664 TaxID=3448125 RepID=UPI003F5C854E
MQIANLWGLNLTVVLLFLNVSVLADEPAPTAKIDEFPKQQPFKMSGELTMVDHVNRMGILRPDRSDVHIKYHWDLPHHFKLLPYGTVYRHGSPATLSDLPLGTHLHCQLFLGPKGKFQVPLLDTDFGQITANQPNSFSPDSQYESVLLMEDDFSFYKRLGVTWNIVSINRETQKLVAERVDTKAGMSHPEGLTGQKTFDLTPSTQVWQGDRVATLGDLQPGQKVLFNLTWCTLFGPGRLTDVWIDPQSRDIAMQHQHRRFFQYLRDRGFPARVDHVTHSENGSGQVTVSFYEGPSPEDLKAFQANTCGRLAVAESNLRVYHQNNDSKPVCYIEISAVESPPPGHSGFSATFSMAELLEGVRPGYTVRLFPSGWQPLQLPREEELSHFDVRPPYLQADPSAPR